MRLFNHPSPPQQHPALATLAPLRSTTTPLLPTLEQIGVSHYSCHVVQPSKIMATRLWTRSAFAVLRETIQEVMSNNRYCYSEMYFRVRMLEIPGWSISESRYQAAICSDWPLYLSAFVVFRTVQTCRLVSFSPALQSPLFSLLCHLHRSNIHRYLTKLCLRLDIGVTRWSGRVRKVLGSLASRLRLPGLDGSCSIFPDRLVALLPLTCLKNCAA